jgi:sn-glycerol 3-phosphate transport system ATP-binding protein
MATVTLKDVSKFYGSTQVLFDINMNIKDGEILVIVGPSGCGKSSLLRMVAGLEEISKGEILIDDRVVNDVEPKDRDIAMVFQNYALYPHMNVFNNMAYGLKLKKLPKEVIRKRVTSTANMLQIEGLLERKPRELSGGQRQRVAMGRAIVREPSVFLFDEPLSNLDAKLRTQMRMEIRELQQRLCVTSLYVTHDQVEAMTLADRLVVLNEGTIEQIDTPQNIYEYPSSTYVAGFIGTPEMNFFNGIVSDGGSSIIMDTCIGKPYPVPSPLSKSQAVTIGVRPEKLILSEPADADFSCIVEAVETLGSETLVHCLVQSDKPSSPMDQGGKSAKHIVVKFPGSFISAPGQSMHLKIADNGIHLFDQASGKRITDIK